MAAVPVLDILFGTKARTVLLRRLARESLPLSARRLAELSGLTHRAVIAALEALVEEGIVSKRTAGPAYQYSLQREHAAVETVLLPVLAAEDLLPGLMTNELVALFSPVALSIIVFGSAARGEDVPGSDVDVLVVTSGAGECEKAEESAETERARFFRRFGRPLSVHCLAQADLSGPWPPFVAAAAGEGTLLFGTDLAALRRAHGCGSNSPSGWECVGRRRRSLLGREDRRVKRHELIAHLRSHGPRHVEISNDLARKICRDLGVPPLR